MFDQRERIALLIDGANLFALKALGFDIDYGKLLQAFRRAPICSGHYYSALVEEQETAGRKGSHATNSNNALMFGRIAAPTQPQETCRSRRHRQDQNA